MKLNKMPKEDLETLSYSDLTEMILKEKKKGVNTSNLFKEICKLLSLSDDDFANQIGDYYTSLTTDKRFILLDGGLWDLKDKHKVEIVIDDDEEEFDEGSDEEDPDEVVETVESEDIDAMEEEEGVDVDDDDEFDDLTIIDDEEMEDE